MANSQLSIISHYFTIFAYKELQKELSKIKDIRFLFTEPYLIDYSVETTKDFNIKSNIKNNISGNEYEIKLKNSLNQEYIAKKCVNWIKEKVEFKSLRDKNIAEARLIYIDNNKMSP